MLMYLAWADDNKRTAATEECHSFFQCLEHEVTNDWMNDWLLFENMNVDVQGRGDETYFVGEYEPLESAPYRERRSGRPSSRWGHGDFFRSTRRRQGRPRRTLSQQHSSHEPRADQEATPEGSDPKQNNLDDTSVAHRLVSMDKINSTTSIARADAAIENVD